MMEKWLEKAKPGDKGLTRPPASTRVSAHKNEGEDEEEESDVVRELLSKHSTWLGMNRRYLTSAKVLVLRVQKYKY